MLPVLTAVLTASRESSVYFFQHANFTLHLYGIKLICIHIELICINLYVLTYVLLTYMYYMYY